MKYEMKRNLPVFFDDTGIELPYSTMVKRLRKEQKMNTAELGRALGVSSRTVENWEQDRTEINPPVLLLIRCLFF